MKNGGSDYTTPNPNTPFSGCSGMDDLTDTNRIPNNDMYGNSLSGSGYTNSRYVNGSGNVVTPNPVYNGTGLDLNQETSGYHWGLAIWNSVDNTARNIRTDVNLPNRAGDTNMAIQIHAIGYLGNGGLDEGLLQRVANAKDVFLLRCHPAVRPLCAGQQFVRPGRCVQHHSVVGPPFGAVTRAVPVLPQHTAGPVYSSRRLTALATRVARVVWPHAAPPRIVISVTAAPSGISRLRPTALRSQ